MAITAWLGAGSKTDTAHIHPGPLQIAYKHGTWLLTISVVGENIL